MTSLEKFLIRRQTAKTIEDPKEKEKAAPKDSSELVSTISHLKEIFPNEAAESIMLLALQYPNRHDLEAAVQKILEESGTFREITDSWNVVKSRDKKKPEPKKKTYRKKEFKEENHEKGDYTAKQRYGEEKKYHPNEKRVGYSEPQKKKYTQVEKPRVNERNNEEEKREPEPRHEEAAENKVEIQEIRAVEENKHIDYPELIPNYEHKDRFVQENWGGKENNSRTVNPPKEIIEPRYSEIAPQVIISQEKLVENRQVKEVSVRASQQAIPEPLPIREHPPTVIQEKAIIAQTPLKKDFGVQVELDYGIPIIVYPYMFQRHRDN